jgi:hypothetical protein
VPDADSFDDYEDTELGIPRATTPVSTKCAADGTATGPLAALDQPAHEALAAVPEPQRSEAIRAAYVPSSYCARVETPGMVPSLGLRLTPGYFLSNSFALSLPIRIAFDAGEGSFSRILVGLRGELLFSEMTEATGFPVSWFFGATYGQIQVKPPPKNTDRPAPYVVSGPVGVHTGINVRMRLHRNFGILISPEIDVLFPDLLFAGDLSIGAEGAF